MVAEGGENVPRIEEKKGQFRGRDPQAWILVRPQREPSSVASRKASELALSMDARSRHEPSRMGSCTASARALKCGFPQGLGARSANKVKGIDASPQACGKVLARSLKNQLSYGIARALKCGFPQGIGDSTCCEISERPLKWGFSQGLGVSSKHG
jgi:hypothetical protein